MDEHFGEEEEEGENFLLTIIVINPFSGLICYVLYKHVGAGLCELVSPYLPMPQGCG